MTEGELSAACRGRIARYKIPRYWKIVDSFPMTVTGKVQKYRMREIAIEELGADETAPGARDRSASPRRSTMRRPRCCSASSAPGPRRWSARTSPRSSRRRARSTRTSPTSTRLPHGAMLLARLEGEPVGVVACAGSTTPGRGQAPLRPASAREASVSRAGSWSRCSRSRRALGFKSLYIETTPGKMAEQYEWYRRLGFRETRKLNFADLDSVVAMELPLYAAGAVPCASGLLAWRTGQPAVRGRRAAACWYPAIGWSRGRL